MEQGELSFEDIFSGVMGAALKTCQYLHIHSGVSMIDRPDPSEHVLHPHYILEVLEIFFRHVMLIVHPQKLPKNDFSDLF